MKHFYTHLIEIDSIIIELDKLDLSEDQKRQLADLVDSNIHHIILDAILSELSEEDKRIFLKHVHEDDHDKIWQHLFEKVDNIEHKIKDVADDFKKQLHKDLKEAKNK